MFRQEKQANLDEFRTNVQKCSHIALERKKGSYSHHILVSEVCSNAIRGIEYGSPGGLTNTIGSVVVKYLGKIQERLITFDELFQPFALSVFLVYCDDYPKTDDNKNAAIQRAKSRLGETLYCLTCNNCEHFVTWALTGKPISLQWRDASAACRLGGDMLAKAMSEVLKDARLLLQKYLPNERPHLFSKYLSQVKEKCLKYLPENTAFDRLKSRISSINNLDVLLFIAYSSLKVVIFSVEGGHSPAEYILEIIKIVGFKICSLLFGINPQLLEIIEKLDLWRRNLISTVDLLREIFKIVVSYLVLLALAIYFPSSIPFLFATFKSFAITVVVSSVAGALFDIGYSILCPK